MNASSSSYFDAATTTVAAAVVIVAVLVTVAVDIITRKRPNLSLALCSEFQLRRKSCVI